MSRERILFTGLGIETGQSQQGLHLSPQAFRSQWGRWKNSGLHVCDLGDFIAAHHGRSPKICASHEFERFPLQIYRDAYRALQNSPQGELHLHWGGDHSVAISSVGAFLHHHPRGKVVWIDAHADMNLPETSPTGNFHGMPLAVLLNLAGIGEFHFPWLSHFLRPENLLMLGVRDLDPFEKASLHHNGIRSLSSEDVRRLGPQRLDALIRDWVGSSPLHVSFDIDSVDPADAPATGVPVDGGLSRQEAVDIAQALGAAPGLCSVDVVEINPLLGTAQQVEETYETAWRFLWPLLLGGKRSEAPSVPVAHGRGLRLLGADLRPALL
ncbi:MAG: arginase family protein [Bdellovibrionaceae bacterium]|nr:arginase family protein [Pseudobdellovibrionaceae bacterium]